jgi:rubrerythrin
MRWLRRALRRLRATRPAEPTPSPPEYTPEQVRQAEEREAHSDRLLTREVRAEAEDNIMASLFGDRLPPVWRCRCGGRPFGGQHCPRCGRAESESGT